MIEIIAISAFVGIVAFAIGCFCGKASPCSHDIYHDADIRLRDMDKILQQDNKIYTLESELRAWKYHFNYASPMYHNCTPCVTKVYAETPDKQEIVDLLMKTQVNVKDLAKKFGIKP